MQNQFGQAIALMRKAGYDDIAAKLETALGVLREETYHIAVVGEFKTGKSTLINRIFLKSDLLFADILEATAVPTQVCFGMRKYLEIIPYSGNFAEGQPLGIANPTARDIRERTSADTPDGRAKLARETARVRLYWPANNLAGLVVSDTPGINSSNEAVIATTYRIIPESDLVLFVKSAKQLSDMETEFLSGRVFGEGITRAIAVVTFDPDAVDMTPEERRNLTNTIRSQLASIGRSYIPVEMVNIRSHSKASGKSFGDRIAEKTSDKAQAKEEISDVIANLLGQSRARKVSESAGEENDFASLEEKLIRFIRDNVRPARTEKAARFLETQLRLAQVRCGAELSAMTKTESERRQMLADIRTREAETRLMYEKLYAEFREELRRLEREFGRDMESGLRRISESYQTGIEACGELGELQNYLKRAEVMLKRDFEDLFFDCSRTARNEIGDIIEKYGMRSRVLLQPWQAQIGRELRIDGGILSKIPPFAILALDMLLFVRFGPLGPLGDVLMRMAADHIPILRKAVPAAIAASVLKHNIRSSLRDQFESIRAELPVSIEKTFEIMGDKLIEEWNAYIEEQTAAVRKSVESVPDQPVNYERFELLTEVGKMLSTLLAGM